MSDLKTKMHQNRFQLRPQTPLRELRGLLLRGGKRREAEWKGGEGKEGKGKGEEGKGREGKGAPALCWYRAPEWLIRPCSYIIFCDTIADG